MLKKSNGMAAAFIGVGMLIGYAAASGNLNLAPWAQASQPAPAADAGQPGDALAQKTSCCDGVDKGQLLALANHNANVTVNAVQTGKKPNICIIWGDDIGQSNVSAYSMGLMGYKTPNIDRVARDRKSVV